MKSVKGWIFIFLSLFFSNVLCHAISVDEWMALSVKDRYAIRAGMTMAERYALWDKLTYEQKMALNQTNAAYEALLSGDIGAQVSSSPYSVNQWITKGPEERKQLRTTFNSLELWNALTLAQKNAMTETNQAYERLQSASADFCHSYSNVQYIDIPISYSRTVLPFRFDNDTIVVARFMVPANYVAKPDSYLDFSVAEYDGPPTYRLTSISTKPCDYRPIDRAGVNGPLDISGGVATFSMINVGPGKPNPQIIPGQTYYLNIKNYYPSVGGEPGYGTCQENTNCKASINIILRNE